MDFSYFGEYEVAVFDIEDKIRLLLVSTGYFAESSRTIYQKNIIHSPHSLIARIVNSQNCVD